MITDKFILKQIERFAYSVDKKMANSHFQACMTCEKEDLKSSILSTRAVNVDSDVFNNGSIVVAATFSRANIQHFLKSNEIDDCLFTKFILIRREYYPFTRRILKEEIMALKPTNYHLTVVDTSFTVKYKFEMGDIRILGE